MASQLNKVDVELTFKDSLTIIDKSDPVEGGVSGIDNKPHIELFGNQLWLKQQFDALKQQFDSLLTAPMPDPEMPTPVEPLPNPVEPNDGSSNVDGATTKKNNLSYILPQDPSDWSFNVMLYPQNTKLNRGDIIDLGQDARPTYYLPELPDDALLDIRLTGYLGYIDDRYDFESRKTIDTIIAPEGYTIKNGKIEFLSRPTPSGEQDCWRPYTTDSKNWRIALPFEVGHQFPTGLIATEDETHYPQQVIMSFYRQDGSSYEGFYWTITSPKVGARSSGGSGGGVQ